MFSLALDKQNNSVNHKHAVLEAVSPQIAYESWSKRHVEQVQKQREEEAAVIAAIDWHAFMVLDTIEFTAEDDGVDLPPGLVQEEVEARGLLERAQELEAMQRGASVSGIGTGEEDDDGDMDVEPIIKRVRVA